MRVPIFDYIQENVLFIYFNSISHIELDLDQGCCSAFCIFILANKS